MNLEQTCPACGRWEAAGAYCSWCGRTMTEADWYYNGDARERARRMPAVAPANPPAEYDSPSHWPASWGPFPRPVRTFRTPQSAVRPPKAAA